MYKTVLRWISRGALVTAAAVIVIAFGMDRLIGREVLILAPHDPAIVRANRAMYLTGDPVAEIYGNPLSKPTRVVLMSEDRIIRPAEDRTQELLVFDAANGDRPLQVQTAWFVTRYSVIALLAIAGLSTIARGSLHVTALCNAPRDGS